MSYCRWSTDDFQCDIYCYEDVGGYFVVDVGGGRYVVTEKLPDPVDFGPKTLLEYYERMGKVTKIMGRSKVVRIGLPCDGEQFRLDTPGETADKLEELREMGYRFPDYVIETLREEQKTWKGRDSGEEAEEG